ncbi:MAG TPA: hypothetical protein VGG44_01375 [Tepidisphaeraceae bacterium]|jgi:hypothetical protein
MSSPVLPSPQLTPEHFRELEAAKHALRKIRRAVSAAKLEGYTVAIFGGLTVMIGITSITDIILGLILLAIGIVELNGAARLRRLDPRGIRLLTINQLTFAVLILLYALWNVHAEIAHPVGGVTDAEAQALGQVDPSVLSLTHEVMLLVYSSFILAALFEAGMAAYFRSRGPLLQQYLAETPEWITSMQKAGVST